MMCTNFRARKAVAFEVAERVFKRIVRTEFHKSSDYLAIVSPQQIWSEFDRIGFAIFFDAVGKSFGPWGVKVVEEQLTEGLLGSYKILSTAALLCGVEDSESPKYLAMPKKIHFLEFLIPETSLNKIKDLSKTSWKMIEEQLLHYVECLKRDKSNSEIQERLLQTAIVMHGNSWSLWKSLSKIDLHLLCAVERFQITTTSHENYVLESQAILACYSTASSA
jgi:hypothetical protein